MTLVRPKARSRDAASILSRLEKLYPTKVDLDLRRMNALLRALGNPHLSLPPVIHVAGTNGKGSTVAFLRAILEAAGRSVHVYTSPHLVTFNERIRIAGTLIDDAHLTDLLNEIETRNAGRPITFFEATTAAALLAFSRHEADFTIIETGMGGRLDATNVVPTPIATAITPISLDHTIYLGETVDLIAREKAGILRPSVPAVVSCQSSEAMEALDEEADRIGARQFCYGKHWSVEAIENWFVYRGKRDLFMPRPPLSGDHQIMNAALALAIIDQIETLRVSGAEYTRGIMHVKWPARLMTLSSETYQKLQLPPGTEIILDGGHNCGAAEALAKWLTTLDDKVDVIVGMLNSRDPREFLGPLAPFVLRLRGVPVEGADHSHAPAAIVEAARDVGISDAKSATSVANALSDLSRDPRAGRIFICGSLHLAGNVLAAAKPPRTPPSE